MPRFVLLADTVALINTGDLDECDFLSDDLNCQMFDFTINVIRFK